MKLAITGVKGMLGGELARCAEARGHEVKGYDLPELDITKELPSSVLDADCDVLVNCAAYTDVDGAESDSDAAYAVNDDGAARLAKWCRYSGTRFVHISTDYVFDGESLAPYSEEVETNPLGVYGASKLSGEVSVLQECEEALIVRTQSLFGPGGKSFPAAIIARLDGGKDLEVVNDQTVCPTCTGHLAEAVLDLIDADARHLVHVSSSGQCTWYDFAREIAALVKPDAQVTPVSSEKFKRPAKRPAYSVFDLSRFELLAGRKMPDWKDALSWYLARIGRQPV
jgi:dTDP-4-dehydrorhamnose reductase